MVTIIGHEKRKNSEDQDFNVLILQGDVEPVISGGTGKPYFTARKTSVPCTFDDKTAKKLVGKLLQGRIDRIECDVYEYEIPSTGKSHFRYGSYRNNLILPGSYSVRMAIKR